MMKDRERRLVYLNFEVCPAGVGSALCVENP